MCVIDGNMDCVIDPVSNAIYNVIFPFFSWIINSIYGIFSFIYSIGSLFNSFYNLIIGLFAEIFATNYYAGIAFSIILLGMTLILFVRIYNIVAGIELFGFKLPRL